MDSNLRSEQTKRCSTRDWPEVQGVPIPSGDGKANKHFDDCAAVVINGWTKLQRVTNAPEKPHSYFKRNIYRLIKAYVDGGREGIFLTMAKSSGRSLVGLDALRGNPFKLALFAMWDDNESLTRHQQRVFGNQMLYAFRHRVAAENLVGFIRAAGSAQTIANKLDTGAREPGFDLAGSARPVRKARA